MTTSTRGMPSAPACRARSSRRTPCMLIRSYVSVTVVISASGSLPSRRSVRSVSAESLPPLQERAKGVPGGKSGGVALGSELHESRGCWVVCPDMKPPRLRRGEIRRRRPPEPPLPPRADVRSAQAVDLARPRLGPHSCGTAPDCTGLRRGYAGRGVCARRSEHTPSLPSDAPPGAPQTRPKVASERRADTL